MAVDCADDVAAVGAGVFSWINAAVGAAVTDEYEEKDDPPLVDVGPKGSPPLALGAAVGDAEDDDPPIGVVGP